MPSLLWSRKGDPSLISFANGERVCAVIGRETGGTNPVEKGDEFIGERVLPC